MSSAYEDFKGVSDNGLGVLFKPDPDQVIADVYLDHGVILEVVRGNDSTWEVWAVRIDGVLYREPRDMEGELLRPGPFADALTNAEASGRQFLNPVVPPGDDSGQAVA